MESEPETDQTNIIEPIIMVEDRNTGNFSSDDYIVNIQKSSKELESYRRSSAKCSSSAGFMSEKFMVWSGPYLLSFEFLQVE
ncbi:hypothetical protein HA402_000555 [Bradysia odoriphaga]|nr:hypothetical protein HA402_000555 [Bradysia odoriphaga]